MTFPLDLCLVLAVVGPVMASTEEGTNETKELCKISDPGVYDFKINVPMKKEVPKKWFKNHPSYLNHTKGSFAEFVGKQFHKFLATVASDIPNFIEIPNIRLQPVSSVGTNGTEGQIWNLREILAGSQNATVYTDWSEKTLEIKFVLHLGGLRVKYHLASTIPKYDDDVEWKLYDGSAVVAMMMISPTGSCPVKFEENEVETAFAATVRTENEREQLNHLTALFKCYVHFLVEEAVYSALKRLWFVLKKTICFSMKQIARSTVKL